MSNKDKLKQLREDKIFDENGLLREELSSMNDFLKILDAQTEEELDKIILEIIDGKKKKEE
jgi:hypothetical protein